MIWFVCSGNGGVGKSQVSAALSVSAAENGKSVILLDASGGARTCDALLGIAGKPVLNVGDVLAGDATLTSVLYSTFVKGLRYAVISHDAMPELGEYSDYILTLQSMCDVLVIDSATGMIPSDSDIMAEDDRVILVTSSDALALRTAEMMTGQIGTKSIVSVFLNRVLEKNRRSVMDAVRRTETVLGYTPECVIPYQEMKENCDSEEKSQINRAVLRLAGETTAAWKRNERLS